MGRQSVFFFLSNVSSKCQTSKEQSHGRVEDTKSVSKLFFFVTQSVSKQCHVFGNKAEKLGG